MAVSRGLGGDAVESKSVSLIPAFRLTIASLLCGSTCGAAHASGPVRQEQHLDSSGTPYLGDGNVERDGR